MATLQSCLPEILIIVMEHLVVAVGIQKAVLLRPVSKAFDTAILYAICTSQIVDMDDPATPGLAFRMEPRLRGKIMLRKSHTGSRDSRKGCLHVIKTVNLALDGILNGSDPEGTRARHEAVAESINPACDEPITDAVALQNLVCGAAIIGNMAIIKSLLLGNESTSASATAINDATPYFPTPLTLAAARGDFEMVQFLLNEGARLDTEARLWTRDEDYPDIGHWNSQDEYLQRWVVIEPRSSALRAAVSGGHKDIVRLLLHPEHRLPVSSPEYLRAILVGAGVGRLNFMAMLLEVIGKQMSDFKNLDKFILWQAIEGDQAEVVDMVLDHGVNVNSFPCRDIYRVRGTLHRAASLSRTALVRLLLERGADPNLGPRSGHYGGLPIEGAAMSGHQEVVDLLLTHGADSARALYGAATGGQPLLVKDLLTRFPELTTPVVLRTCLQQALDSCNLTAMTILVEAGVRLDDCDLEEDARFRNPIDKAMVYFERSWVVQHLISLGAVPTDADKAPSRTYERQVRGVLLSERTWDWVGKY